MKMENRLNNFTIIKEVIKVSPSNRYIFECNKCKNKFTTTKNQIKVGAVICCKKDKEDKEDFEKKIAKMRKELEEGKIIEYTIYKSKTIKFYFEYYHKKKCRIASGGSLKIMSENQPRSKKYINESTILIGDTIESTEKGLAIRRKEGNTFNS
tara:strand:- start:1235 stop:1693 length:459 start_codon:yes stop_codon:yes gene_type:complete